jgi:geranylgeranyl reductase
MSIRQDHYDVVVVGAGFSGASFARVGAGHGLRILVLEKARETGKVVRTTGVVFTELLEVLDIPRNLLLNQVNTIHMYPPRTEALHVSTPRHRFFMTDTPRLLSWLVKQAEAHGAEVRWGAKFLYAERDKQGIVVGYRRNGKIETLRTDFLVGADGPVSTVTKTTNLHLNTKFLVGVEWCLDGIEIEPTAFHLLFSASLAPGYCVWLAPRGSQVALGVAGYAKEYCPPSSLEGAVQLFGRHTDIPKDLRIVGRRVGLIAVGGVERPFHNSWALLVGDAAGLCGVASGQGIFQAVLSGKLAGRYVSEYLGGLNGALAEYVQALKSSYNLKRYLSLERKLRAFIDAMQSDEEWELLFNVLRSPSFQPLLTRGLLATSIPGFHDFGREMLIGLARKLPYAHISVADLAWLGLRRIGK